MAASLERRGSRFSEPGNGCGVTVEVNSGDARDTAEVAQAAAKAVKIVSLMDAVVKVFCVHTEPNFSLPWQRKRQYSSSRSGFIIEGQRVLTNAHSVEHHTRVKLKKRGSDAKYLVTVLAEDTECDIGGAAFSDKGKCVSIAFQSLKFEDVENVGYVIRTPAIMHFIQDYEKNGKYKGFPVLGVEWQKMENPDLHKLMGVQANQKGVCTNSPAYSSRIS